MLGTLAPILLATVGLPGGGAHELAEAAAAVAAAGATGSDASGPSPCIICGDTGTADLILNILLFIPFGAALRYSGRSTLVAGVVGLLLSTAIEGAQLGIPGRHTTLGDLLANSSGALLGAALFGPGPLSLRAPPTPKRVAAGLALVAGVWIGGHAARATSFPATTWYGQWTADLGYYDQYPGEVLSASIAGRPLPSWRLEPAGHARKALLAGDTLEIAFIAGTPPGRPAPIFSIYDDLRKEMLFLGAHGEDLVISVRRRAADWRLRRSSTRWSGVLRPLTPGDTASLRLWLPDDRRVCAARGRETWCHTPIGPSTDLLFGSRR